jgi:hypothetical protein
VTDAPPEFPKRLLESGDPAGELIRACLRAPSVGPNEAHSFRRVNKRVSRRAPRWSLGAAVVAVAASVAASISFQRARHEEAPSIRAEQALSALPATLQPRAASTVIVRKPTEAPVLLPAPRPSARRVEPEHEDTARCAKLGREGSYELATACYSRIANGRSMAAELALYEKARLQSKALGDSLAALATLEEHARRFPAGVLATESTITRIELLTRLGRGDAALSATQLALQGPAGRERRGDLQVLRAELLSARGECVAALQAATEARSAGVHPARLVASERRCAPDSALAPGPSAGFGKQ